MSNNIVVMDAGWGDAGKGRVIDLLGKHYDITVRFHGGANAGHTLVVDGEKTVFHLMPSGVLWNHMKNVVGPGVVVDPEVLSNEIQFCVKKNLITEFSDNLVISPLCQLVLPHHKELDGSKKEGDNWLGSTKQGIGPTYAGKANRTGLRIADLVSNTPAKFIEKLKQSGVDTLPQEGVVAIWKGMLKPYVKDVTNYLLAEIECGKKILFEGAQGFGLDIDFGTYPYVTSSNCVPAYAAVGAGIPHKFLGDTLAITKAYSTRVGTGPFPTKMSKEEDDFLRNKAGEFGATTGRPRMCGWLDLVQLRRAKEVTGFTRLALTKLDILEDFDVVKLCIAYVREDGSQLLTTPDSAEEYEKIKPLYVTFEKFGKVPNNLKSVDELSSSAQSFVRFIEGYLSASIDIICTGPERGQEIKRNKFWE